MNLTTKLSRRLHSLFRINTPESWARISAADVLAVPDCGKAALNKLRLYLAYRGVSLRGDNPPSYWLETLGKPTPEDPSQCVGVCPFTVVIDTNETYPFPFDAIHDSDGNTVSVPTVRRPLYISGLADYTIDGMELDVQIERKAEDLESSMSERRDIFEQEICRLNDCCTHAWVIVEKEWSEILQDDHTHGARAKSISRTVIAWQVKYPGVHWNFCAGRYHAEQVAFRLLEKVWWAKQRERSTNVVGKIVSDLFSEV